MKSGAKIRLAERVRIISVRLKIMITVLKPNTTIEQRDHLISWFEKQNIEVHISVGSEYTVLGLVGDTAHLDMSLVESLSIVDSVKRVSESYKQCRNCLHRF